MLSAYRLTASTPTTWALSSSGSCARLLASSRLHKPTITVAPCDVARVNSVSTGGVMKDAIDSMPAERTIEPESFANRKLIRPSLNRSDHPPHPAPPVGERRAERPERAERGGDRNGGAGRKSSPPEQTNA